MGGLLMMMKRLSSITLVSLLLLQTLAINYLQMPRLQLQKVAQKMISVYLASNLVMHLWNRNLDNPTRRSRVFTPNDLVEVTVTVFKDGAVTEPKSRQMQTGDSTPDWFRD